MVTIGLNSGFSFSYNDFHNKIIEASLLDYLPIDWGRIDEDKPF